MCWNRRSPFAFSLLAAALCTLLVVAGCGGKKSGKSPADADKTAGQKTADGKQTGDKKSSGNSTPEADVYATLDAAIATAKKHDIKTFIELYMPVDELREMRQAPGGIDRIIKKLKSEPKMMKEVFEQRILPPLEAARKAKPVFNADKTIARFKIVASQADVVKVGPTPLTVEKNKAPTVTGYGADLQGALKKAVADLEAGKAEAYLTAMLPVVELKLNDVAALAKRLKQAPAQTGRGDGEDSGSFKKADPEKLQSDPRKSLPLDNGPKPKRPKFSLTMLRMIADLKSLIGKKHELQGESVAVFKITVQEKVAKEQQQPKPVTRVFKFQKVGGNWRLFDNTTPMRKASQGMSRKLAEANTKFAMEKIGNQWRIMSERSSGHGGKTERDDEPAKSTYKKTGGKYDDKTYDPSEKTPKFPRSEKTRELKIPPPEKKEAPKVKLNFPGGAAKTAAPKSPEKRP